jgi:aspartate ammonia-lyase
VRNHFFTVLRLPAETAETAKEASKTDNTIREVAREQNDLAKEDLDWMLDAQKMM